MVGTLREGGRVLQKSVHSRRHFLTRPPAIALDFRNLQDMERQGARLVQIDDLDTGRCFTATFETIWAAGFALNRGYGDQWAVPLHAFTCDGQAPKVASARPQPKPEATQPGLF
jgi:hypothetical protein